MEKSGYPPTKEEINSLRKGIQSKYNTYKRTDRDRFPDFEFNTNRANYEPLRDSFEEEFFETRRIDRATSNIHIPSTNTLARLFSEPDYVPSRKILNTCYSYVEGPSKIIDPQVYSVVDQPEKGGLTKNRAVQLTGIVLLVSIAVYAGTKWFRTTQPASGLVITRPSGGITVPREILATGEVKNAETVWIVIHAKGGVKYWVQPPIKVEEDNTWRGGIYIGSDDRGDIGVTSQIQAFVNPATALKEGDVLRNWPEAELSSNRIEVVRGVQKE